MGLFDRFKKKKMPTDQEIADSVAEVNELFDMDVKDIWSIKDSNPFIIAMNGWVCRKCHYGEQIAALTAEERTFYIVTMLEAEVNNGGFEQYLYNSSGNFANELVAALRSIGADATADIYQKALDALGCELPSNRDAREEVLARVLTDDVSDILDECDSVFYQYPDNIEALSYQFIIKNKSYFV